MRVDLAVTTSEANTPPGAVDTSGQEPATGNNTLVEKARAEEIAVTNELGVWEVVDRPNNEVVYGTRWVDINKGGEDNPYYRSRLVVQEYKKKAEWASFTATPHWKHYVVC